MSNELPARDKPYRVKATPDGVIVMDVVPANTVLTAEAARQTADRLMAAADDCDDRRSKPAPEQPRFL